MATINPVAEDASDDSSIKVITWPGIGNGDDGRPVKIAKWADKTIHFTGTFGSGGTVKLQGSNDGTNWLDLTDPQGAGISKSGAAIEAVTENPLYIRPAVTAGDGTTAINAILVARLSNPLRN